MEEGREVVHVITSDHGHVGWKGLFLTLLMEEKGCLWDRPNLRGIQIEGKQTNLWKKILA